MPIEQLLGGVTGVIGGAVAGALAMLYQKSKTDKKLEDNDRSIRAIERSYMPRNEIIQMHKDNKDEMKSMHRDLNNKLDEVIKQLGQINITLVGKADKE